MRNKSVRERGVTYPILISMMVITVLFIFSNSLLPPEQSAQESGAVSGFLSHIIPTDNPIGEFIIKNIRKIAHFAEYGLLGVEAAIFVNLYVQNRWKYTFLAIFAAICIGAIDESLQFISGRGPAILDVLIDTLGFITLTLLTHAGMYISHLVGQGMSTRLITTEKYNG